MARRTSANIRQSASGDKITFGRADQEEFSNGTAPASEIIFGLPVRLRISCENRTRQRKLFFEKFTFCIDLERQKPFILSVSICVPVVNAANPTDAPLTNFQTV
jgi:hypothetical protein